MKSRMTLSLLVALLGISGALIASTPVEAAGSSCGSFSFNIWGRVLSDAQFMAGSQADMTVRKSDLCGSVSNNTNAAAEWVMIQGIAQNDGWAQNGYAFRAGCDCRQFFYEFEKYADSNNGPVFIGTLQLPWSPTPGSAFVFKTTWKYGDDNKIHAIYCQSSGNNPPGGQNCVDFAHTNWNPIGAGWSASVSTWAGETHFLKSDLPGTESANAISRYMLARRYLGSSLDPWYEPGTYSNPVTCKQINDGTGTPGCGDSYFRYHLQVVNPTRFDIWTCPLDPIDPPC